MKASHVPSRQTPTAESPRTAHQTRQFAPAVETSPGADAPFIRNVGPYGHTYPLQRTTVATPTSETDDFPWMVEEATRFHRSGGTGQLFDDDNDRIIEGTADNTDTHVDVFAHGNQAQVGDYDVSGLKTALGRWKDTLSLAAIHSVTLHSCESGTEHPTSGRRYGDLLHESFREGQEYVDVTGFSGETVTDRTGATRVLKEGKKLKEWNRQSRLLEGEALGILEDDYLEPEGTGKIRFGDQALDMYSAPADPYGDPEEERAKRVEETRKQLSWIKTEMEVPEEIVIGGRPTQLPSGHRPLGQ